jgi:hypothetical protein
MDIGNKFVNQQRLFCVGLCAAVPEDQKKARMSFVLELVEADGAQNALRN